MKPLYKGILGLGFYAILWIVSFILLGKNIHFIAVISFLIFVIVQIILWINPNQKQKRVSTALLAIGVKFILTMTLVLGIMYFFGKTSSSVWIIFGIAYLFNTLMTRA
jgi:hypothetical protein